MHHIIPRFGNSIAKDIQLVLLSLLIEAPQDVFINTIILNLYENMKRLLTIVLAMCMGIGIGYAQSADGAKADSKRRINNISTLHS